MLRRFFFQDLDEGLTEPVRLLSSFLGFTLASEEEAEIKISVITIKQGLRVSVEENRAELAYSRQVEFFRALGLFTEKLSDSDIFDYQEQASFQHLTYMQDNSRNAVSNLDSVKKMIRHLALMGFDSFMLYTEDTYEIEGYPFFGYLRGRFSIAELKDINAYAAMFGIEMVPCIQTLAHLNAAFRWDAFNEVKDISDILLCGEQQTYDFIEAMIKTCAEVFTSRRINIGMDEAEMLGLGRYLKINGYRERFDIMLPHLKKVLELCDKYGMKAMMWSDMFFKLLSDNSDDYYAKFEISEEVRGVIPGNVQLIYWDYYTREKDTYDRMIRGHKQLTDNIGFAGGAWRWTGFAPLLQHSIGASRLALQSCIEQGITDILVTGWGDNGSETSSFVVGPVLQLYAESCYNSRVSEEQVAKRLAVCTHMNYEDFMELSSLNYTPDNPAPGRISIAPSRYLFYQDPLLGIYDKQIDRVTYPAHYQACYETLQKIAVAGGEYSYIFHTLAKLAYVLEIKSDLGIRLKEAYDAKDFTELSKLAGQDCPELLRRIEDFQEALRKQWLTESKPFGLEVLDLRIGGLKERVRATKLRLEEYLDKVILQIEELEQERLYLEPSENPGYASLPVYANEWRMMATAAVL